MSNRFHESFSPTLNTQYTIGPFSAPVANWRTIGSSVVSNSSELPSHTTFPPCKKISLSTARRIVLCWCVTTM
eukprot:30918-Pelagococcus_subviridis.AAC.59